MRRGLLLIPVVLFAGLVLVMGWLLLFAEDGRRNASIIPSALIGQPVPAFSLPPVEGASTPGFSSDDLKGQATIVNVFASWCVPCLAEHPLIAALAAEGIPVYGLDHKDQHVNAARWLATHGNPYTAVGADVDGRVSIDWGVTGVPETFVIDPEGIIRFKWTGPLTPELVADKLRPAYEAARQ